MSASPSCEFHDRLTALLPKMRGWAMTLTKNRATAEDLVQDVALKALGASESFIPGTNFSARVHRGIPAPAEGTERSASFDRNRRAKLRRSRWRDRLRGRHTEEPSSPCALEPAVDNTRRDTCRRLNPLAMPPIWVWKARNGNAKSARARHRGSSHAYSAGNALVISTAGTDRRKTPRFGPLPCVWP